MTRFNRGNVVLVLFPDSNLRTAKRRPVLIVQANALNTGLQQHVVAMISSNLSRAGHPCRVLVHLDSQAGRLSGLLTDSVIMTDNLTTIMDHEFDKIIGHIPNMTSVNNALHYTLGLLPGRRL